MLHFVNLVNSVGNELTQKDLFLAVEPLLDDRKDVFRMNRDVALFCFFLGCHKKTSRKL